MAINFYSSISLNKNELQNAVVQNAGSDPGSPAAGQIYYNSGDNTLRVYDGSNFVTLSTTTGDITGVTAGAGLTGGGSSGAVTLNAIAGTGITVNANDIQTNDSEIVHDNLSGFVANEHIDHSGVTITAGTGLTGGGSIDGSRTINAVGGDGITANANDLAITAAQTTITSVLNTSLVLGRDADNQIKFGTDNQIIFRVGAGDNVIFKASGEIEASSLDISGDADVDGTLEADAITVNGTALDEFIQDTVGAMFSSNTETRIAATYQDGDGTIDLVVDDMTANDNDDVSNANLLTRLAALESASGAANENIVIGTDSGDTVVITGNLQVSGTTTTVDSTTVTLNDHNIVLDSGNSTSAVVDGAGITLEGGSGNDVTFMWSAGNSRMELKEGSSATDLLGGTFIGALEGNADTATVGTNVTVTANNSANETVYLTFVDGATGTQGLETDTALNYNPSSNILTVVELDVSGDVDVDGTLETDALTIGGAAVLAQATTSAVGAVELATSAETQTGTSTTRAVTPDGLAARHVVADIDVSSLTDANIVTITHNLGTADIMVQVYDITTEANIMCDIARTTDDFSTASTSVVSIDFGTAPPNDCRALITSLKGATASGTVAYT